MPGSIWNLFTTCFGGEAVVFRTLVLLNWQLLCCKLKFTIKTVTHAKSWVGFFFFWLLMIVVTSYAIYLNWIMVPDKVIGMKLVYHPLWCVINRKFNTFLKKRKQIRSGWLTQDPWTQSQKWMLFCYIGVTAADAKLLQSCPTLCDPIDGSPPGCPIPGILQARTLEWVAISSSNAWKWKVKVKLLSRVRLFETPWTAAYQAPPSMGFSRQEYWSGVPSPSLI